jgi:GNAT superfamily N-acetyltransferase
MRIKLKLATPDDVADLVGLRAAVNENLRSQYGDGYWLARPTEKSALFVMTYSRVYIARHRNKLIASLTLSTRKPWAIDKKYFYVSEMPLYLTAMAVTPTHQHRGIGRSCIEQARQIAVKWPADAIRLDAYDADAGAGEFYRKCDFREVGRAVYRVAPLIYFEILL